jgi:HK97 family phage portal protein
MSQTEKLSAARAYIAERGIQPFGWMKEQRGMLENPRYSLDDPGVMDALWYDAGTLPPVRPQRAIQTSAVFACVRILAETLATLPCHLYKKINDRDVTRADNHPLYGVLHDEPNSYQSAFQFFQASMSQLALWGNFYAEIQRDSTTGQVIGIYPLPAWEVQPALIRTGNSIRKVYNVAGEVLEDADVLHIPALGWDGVKGISPIALHRATITMSLNAEEFGANFFKNGTRLSGVLQHPGKISAEASARLRESWQQSYAGKANSGKVALLEEGMIFNALSMPLADAQFIEQRKFQIDDIARIFRIPPHMVGSMASSTNNNIEQQALEFVKHTMLPWIKRWEQEINRKLIPSTQRRKYFVKFNVDDLLRGDFTSRVQGYASARQWGWMSANDVREKEDMNMIEGGDVYLSPSNMMPADKLDQEEDQINNEPPEPAEPQDPAAGAENE